MFVPSNSSDTERTTTETPKSLIGGGVTETLDTAQGGGRGHHVAIPVNVSRDGVRGGVQRRVTL